jgi:hypothetical protein
MASHEVADGGDELQIQHVAANILNKHSWRAKKAVHSSWGLSTDS